MKETLSPLGVTEPVRTTAHIRAERAAAPEGGLSVGALAAFILGSFFVHGGAYAALSSLPTSGAPVAQAPQELVFTVLAPERQAEPIRVAPEPPPPVRAKAPRPVLSPEPKPAAVAPQPEPEQPAPAPIQHLATSSESGLSVAGSVGAAQPLAGTSLTGAEGGTGLGKAAPSDGATRIDLRRLAKDWTTKVSETVAARALREYPRSALRAHVEGLVTLSIRIGPDGLVDAVQLVRSSGHPQLDEAAIASARALRQVPAPPSPLHPYLHKHPLTVPVNFTID